MFLNFLVHQKHGLVAKNHYQRKVTNTIITATQVIFHCDQNEKNPTQKGNIKYKTNKYIYFHY